MKRFGWVAPLAVFLACGSNPSVIPSGDFSGPTGLAIAPLPDRDLLFVANQGSNELRALILCNSPPGVATTCSDNEDGRFLPGPIRLFAGSILAGQRPLRLAGVRLLDAGALPHGAVLVAGSEPVLRVVDATNVFAASQHQAVTAAPAREMLLPDAPIDVVAAGASGASVLAVVVTQAPAGGLAALTVLTVSLGADGIAQPTAKQQCTLDFVPTRLALIPGSTAGQDDLDADGNPKHLYVADGTPGGTPGGRGDGAVEVSIPAIPAIQSTPGPIPPCTAIRRLPASDAADSPRRARPLRSLALSPAFIDAKNVRTPGGLFMLAVTAPDDSLCAGRGTHTCDPAFLVGPGTVCVDHGERNCGAGRIVILGNDPVGGQSSVLAAPPVDLPVPPSLPFLPGVPTMVPLRAPAPAREVAFMGRDTCPPVTPDRTDLAPPCTSLRAGVGTSPANAGRGVQVFRQLIGLASTEDGSTVFIDVLRRRFFDDLRDTEGDVLLPTIGTPLFGPQAASGVETPQFVPTPPATDSTGLVIPGSKQLAGWMNPGVTRTSHWRVVWHITIPGLESIGGNLSRAGSGPIRLTLPAGKDLTPWIASPELQLGAASTCTVPYPDCVGDFVRVLSYSATANCADLARVPFNVDIPITAVRLDGLDLQPVPGFDPDPACFASGTVGATFEVRAGNTTAGAWTVVEDLNVLGRLPHGAQFVVTGPRFGYPLDTYPNGAAPPPADFALSFSITGPEPTVVGTLFDVAITDGQSSISLVRDTSAAGTPGFAGPLLIYDSPRRPDQTVFIAITGSNSLMRVVPAQFGFSNSILPYY